MIDLVYQTLLTIINKDNQGYVSPTEFNILANNVQNEILRGYFEDINKNKNKENRGLTNTGYGNLGFNVRQRLQQFAVLPTTLQVSLGNCNLPDDLYFIEDNGVITGTTQVNPNVLLEEVERGQLNIMNNSLAKPTALYPVYERYAKTLRILPTTITQVKVSYLRKPNFPNWTYFMLPNGQPAYNPADSSFQDFELHESEFSNVVLKLLSYFGINLRESDVVQIAEVLKDKQNLKENN
jgi:hypothetical protein